MAPELNPDARHRPLPDARDARDHAGRLAAGRRRDRRLPHLLRRRGRHPRAGRGGPQLGRPADRRRGLGLALPLPRGPARARDRRRRRPGALGHPQAGRAAWPSRPCCTWAPGAGELARRARDRARPAAGQLDQPQLAAARLARRRPPPRGDQRRASCSTRRSATVAADPRPRSARCSGLEVLDDHLLRHPGVYDYDPLRLAIDVRGTGATGYELAELLREQSDIGLELCGEHADRRRVRHRRADRRELRPAAWRPARRRPTELAEPGASRARDGALSPPPRWGPLAMTPREAFLGPQEVDPDRERRRPGGRRVAGRLPARHPQRVPRRAPDGRDAQLHQAHDRAGRHRARAQRPDAAHHPRGHRDRSGDDRRPAPRASRWTDAPPSAPAASRAERQVRRRDAGETTWPVWRSTWSSAWVAFATSSRPRAWGTT